MFQSLLQKFEHVFQDEVPKELPLIIGIEYKIDFISVVVMPNRLAYKVNLTETEEIQKRVEELCLV